MSIIVYGPQGSGKPSHAVKIAQYFGLNKIILDWSADEDLPADTLALTCVEGIEGARHLDEVLAEIDAR